VRGSECSGECTSCGASSDQVDAMTCAGRRAWSSHTTGAQKRMTGKHIVATKSQKDSGTSELRCACVYVHVHVLLSMLHSKIKPFIGVVQS
jgi:hypothetical protein